MKLLSLKLGNFKGVKNFRFDPNGLDAIVYGDNATGKTTLYDGLLWLLFDKDSHFKSAAVKTLDVAGNEIHGLDHTVEGAFLLDTGKTITLKKIMSEDWIKKRGSAEKVFSGHSTQYWVDEVPYKLKGYKAIIADLVPDEELFKLLSSPFYFSSVLPWQKRRELLLSIVGDIPDTAVIAADESLTGLLEIIGDHNIDDYKKIVTEQLRDINKQIQSIPIRIDEASRLLPDLTGLNQAELKKQRASINKEIKALTDKLRAFAATPDNRRDRLELELMALKNNAENAIQQQVFAKQEELQKKRLELEHLWRLMDEGTRAGTLFGLNEKRMSDLRAKYHDEQGKSFAVDEEKLCETCGQAIPAEMQQEAFNAFKSQNLEKIQSLGKSLKAENEKLEKTISAGQEAETSACNLSNEVDVLAEQIKNRPQPEPTPKMLALEKELAELEAGPADHGAEIARIKEEREMLQSLADTKKEQLDKFTTAKDIKSRIEDLKNEERLLAGEYETIEGHKFMLETFVRTKVSLLENRITGKLNSPGLSVKMFAEQINGGLSECCEVIYNGVPFNAGLNNGMAIKVGLHLISMLSEHYGVTLPVMIDNAESVTDLGAGPMQTIQLVVSKKHKELTVETTNKKEVAV